MGKAEELGRDKSRHGQKRYEGWTKPTDAGCNNEVIESASRVESTTLPKSTEEP